MSAATATKFISVEDYLTTEEAALQKHEYYKGEVFAMASAGIEHNRVVRNTQTAIDNFLLEDSCEIFPSDLRIHIEANSLFTYPDLTIFCDPIERYNNRTDTATNPTIIIEVLSRSTQEYDRGTKFNLYRQIHSLKEYIMISSTEVLVEKYVKQSDNEWLFTSFNKTDDNLQIEAIGFSLQISSLYRNINFGEE